MGSQLGRILRDLERHKRLFDFTRNGFGAKLMDIAAESILDRMNEERSPDGTPWPELSDRYAAWKETHYPGEQMAELERRMKTLQQLDGEREINPEDARQTYGVDEGAREEASWFAEGDEARNRPPRPFYDLSDEGVARLDDFVEAWGNKGV